MKNITVRELEALKPKTSAYKCRVDRGLYIRVSPDGAKTWLARYSVDGKQKDRRLIKPFGKGIDYMSLSEAKAEVVHIQSLAKASLDFQEIALEERKAREISKAKKSAESLKLAQLFESWVENGTSRKDGGKELRRNFKKDVLPLIGDKLVCEVLASDIREVLRKIVSRGANRTAVMLLTDIQQMFRWGCDEQPWRKLLIEGDPSKRIDIKVIVSPDYDISNERDRVLSDKEISELASIFKAMQVNYESAADKRIAIRPVTPITQKVLWLCLSTTCRIGELLMTRWEHVNFEKSEWFVPKENSKATTNKRNKRKDWLVQLSDFSRSQFAKLYELTGHSEWCFPASNKPNTHVCLKSVSKQVGDRQTSSKNRKRLKGRRNDDSLLLSGGQWTPHDLRRTGSTIMQALGVDESIRERCLNHAVGGKIGRIYGRHSYEQEKREAWQKLGYCLDQLIN